MRQLHIRVPDGCGTRVVETAKTLGGTNLTLSGGTDGARPVDLVLVHISNEKVERLLDEIEDIDDLHITLAPRGVITMEPPPSEAPEQALDVAPLSPIEVFLGGLQSIGAWKGFLGYALAAGIVVWIGLFTETIFLLTAAMLIAPFAGPAMNAALATARGDLYLFRRSLLRYFAAIAVTVASAFLLSMIMQQEIATGLMVDRSLISSVAVLLPLVAGAAGALNLCQSERSSLVSGAATGMLVAASLAPPAGVVGMAAALGEWGMVKSAAFVLLLQIVGINLAGSLVFRAYGVSPQGARFERGRGWVRYASWGVTMVLGAALIAWQFSSSPELLRSTQAQRAAADVRDVVRQSGLAKVVQVDTRFTRADIKGQNTLLVTLYVEPAAGAEVEAPLAKAVKAKLNRAYDVTPMVHVVALER